MTDDAEPPSSLAQLTAEIVSAYVTNNKIAVSDVAALITAVGSQMPRLAVKSSRRQKTSPSPRCPFGAPFSPTTSYAWSAASHRRFSSATSAPRTVSTPTQYRERFDLKPDYPMAAPSYTERRRGLDLQIGLGRPKKPARRRRKKPMTESSPGEVGQ